MNIKPQPLTAEESIEFVEDLWGSVAVDQQALRLTTEQKAELDRRLDVYEVDGNPGRLVTQAMADIRRT